MSLSLAESLLPSVSVMPAGGDTVAVFSRLPRAKGSIVPARVSVTIWVVARLRPVHSPVALS